MTPSLPKALVAEAIGAFTLSFIGILAISASAKAGQSGIANLASIGLAHGLAIGVMVAALGGISGGHFNPAVTFGFLVTGRLPLPTAIGYWVAQLAGATLAGLITVAAVGTHNVIGATPALTNCSPAMGIVLEAIGTFFLVLVVFGTAVDPRAPKNIYPLTIGLTIAIDIMAFGPLTGCAVNPSRWFGPAMATMNFTDGYVWIVGPLLGGAVAALLYHHFLAEPEKAAA